MTRIAIFASGAGSNAQTIIDFFRSHQTIAVVLIVCNNPHAGVIKIADKEKIPLLMISKDEFFRGSAYLPELQSHKVDFIVLAGFLWKLPSRLIAAFPNAIVNIHPALLPKFGGKGMYGMNVHAAVINAQERESGITIHYVDEHYDNGDVIFQQTCSVEQNETPESLALKIRKLEHQHFPRVIEQVISLRKQH